MLIIIELQRAPFPEAVGEAAVCGVCRRPFSTGLVLAHAHVRAPGEPITEAIDLGEACLACATYLHVSNPDRFPDVEERLDEWTSPAYASVEEADRALGF